MFTSWLLCTLLSLAHIPHPVRWIVCKLAYYCYYHCVHTCNVDAIDFLLVADSLSRGADVATRIHTCEHCQEVHPPCGRHQGPGRARARPGVLVFSTQHVSGEQLEQMTGVAALLRFPIPEVNDNVPTGSSMGWMGAADGD